MFNTAARERRISAAFVAVADTLTTDFDMVDLLHTLVDECTTILDTSAGGLMLLDSNGQLQLMTSTSEGADFVEVMQLNASAGPCIESFSTGTAVSVADIRTVGEKWPDFQRAAIESGFKSAHATPMKLRGRVIGTMNLFSTKRGGLSERDAAVAQALTDVATIGILQERIVREVNTMADQLHRALDSRVLVERAKGMIAQSQSLDMDAAFAVIRAHARANGLTIREVAEGVCDRSIDMALAGRRAPAHRQVE
ncbi:MAG: ANTAR domain-containing protein [Rhodoglobus sp.]